MLTIMHRSGGQARAVGHGFTLIELLVVVAILSAASLLAFGIVTEDRAQIRYDDTRLRLQSLRRAILGQLGPVNPEVVGGFVADNGDLPSDLATLVHAGSLLAQGVHSPLFDPVPDTATCASNGGEIVLSDSSAVLVKGHRGDYLGGLTFNGRFRDGWGNENGDPATDALNFGWSIEGTSPSLTVTSLGNDNAAGGSDDFAADRSLSITANDWQVPLQGWSVRLVARTDIPASQPLSVSLLVFRNTAAGGQWRRYSTPISSVCLDGNGDGLVGGSACPQSSLTLSFTAHCKAGDTSSGATVVPQGRHLLLVTGHTGALWSTGDSPYWDAPINTRQSLARIDAVTGMALPEVRLELR